MNSMFSVLSNLPGIYLRRLGLHSKKLPLNYTFSLTTRCNSRCLTCNIWKNKTDELSIEEWEKTLISLGTSPYWVTLSGGEPFLFPDLIPLCKVIRRVCNPGIINIPTNSLLANIPEKVAQIADIVHPAQLIINLSLDGVGEDHDRIRGIPGNFDRFESTFLKLTQVARAHKNLTIGIHSVVSVFNIEKIQNLMDYVKSMYADQIITEIAEERVELGTINCSITPDSTEYLQIIDYLASDLQKQKFIGVARFTRAFRLEYYQLVKRIIQSKTQAIPCYAGWASAQIFADGTVWPCCIRGDPLGNLREANYDFPSIWFGEKADKVRTSIRQKECWCTLANASYTNMLFHFPTLIRAISHIPQSGSHHRQETS